jgi:acetyl esterase
MEETRAFNEQLRAMLASLPAVESIPPVVTRRLRYEGKGVFPPPEFLPHARWVDANGVRLRVLVPEEPRGVYLHLHGGGWTIGAADLQDVGLWALAQETGLAMASVEYRLAPEHPYPAAPDDCETAARWLILGGHEELGVPARFAIGGESAGAHLAVLTLLRLRELNAFAAANLVYGAYDLSGTPSRRQYAETLVLTNASMNWFTDNFLPEGDLESRRDPAISPLYAELTGMPPALFSCGTLDPLLDDTLFMEARWRSAGNETELRLYDDGVHGFNAFPIAIAVEANAAQAAFLRRAT